MAPLLDTRTCSDTYRAPKTSSIALSAHTAHTAGQDRLTSAPAAAALESHVSVPVADNAQSSMCEKQQQQQEEAALPGAVCIGVG
jgi:hypothetical protein